MEAALVAVPTIASPMPAYLNAIDSGRNGLIAQSDVDWRDHLQYLIENAAGRLAIGNAAQDTTLQHDSLENRSTELSNILGSRPSGSNAQAQG
jgi:glycosyltransferase involved in cell wall biosynthesis